MSVSGQQSVEAPLRLEAGVDPREHVEAWLAAPELAALVTGFGGEPPEPGEDPVALLTRLEEFSAVWDSRRGRERNQVFAAGFTDEQVRLILAAAPALGQEDVRPPRRRDWDLVIVLGGLLRACFSRPLITAGLIRSGAVRTGHVVGVGALRPVNENERKLGEQIAELLPPDTMPVDELDAVTFGFRHAFALDGVFHEAGENRPARSLSWRVLTYAGETETRFQVFAAAGVDPVRRASTPEALAWFAEHDLMRNGASVLIVTTEIYRHYHLVDAIHHLGLPHRASVDCVGMRPGDADPRLTFELTPAARAQEIRSSIRAVANLMAALG